MTDSLRLMCADILDDLSSRADEWGEWTRLTEGAEALRYAERWEYGDPVPAAEHAAVLDEVEGRVAEVEGELSVALNEARERGKAFATFEKAFAEFDEGVPIHALTEAFDKYQAAVK